MNSSKNDNDPPTLVRSLSPRVRTSLAAGDMQEEPTVVVGQKAAPPLSDIAAAPVAPLQNSVLLIQQLENSPERQLVRAAAPLLLIAAQLRASTDRADVLALRRQVIEEMDRFQQLAQKLKVEPSDIIAARYVLCALIDETVLMTPWGSRSEWSSNSLLNHYHNETWGGEKVFVILERITAQASPKIPLLLLIHNCLMLGFEGRYRVIERGREQLEDLSNEISRIIRHHLDTPANGPLSAVAVGETQGRNVRALLPLWMAGTIGLSLVLIAYIYFSYVLSGALDPLLAKISAVKLG